jgi:uncharacterized ferritin-like protein (DUF455 family)
MTANNNFALIQFERLTQKSLIAAASYANLKQNPLSPDVNRDALKAKGFSDSEATAFLNRYEIVYANQDKRNTTGFQALVVRDKLNPTQTDIGLAGTEPSVAASFNNAARIAAGIEHQEGQVFQYNKGRAEGSGLSI